MQPGESVLSLITALYPEEATTGATRRRSMLTKKGLDEQTMGWNQRSNNYYLQRRWQHRPPALLIIILTVDNARLQQASERGCARQDEEPREISF